MRHSKMWAAYVIEDDGSKRQLIGRGPNRKTVEREAISWSSSRRCVIEIVEQIVSHV